MNVMTNQERLRLYLIRHGEVEGAADGKLLGRTDTPLSKRGLAQSHALAEALSEAKLSAVCSSDLERTRMTAEIIAKRSNLKVQESSAWREIDLGQWEGRTIEAYTPTHLTSSGSFSSILVRLHIRVANRSPPSLLRVQQALDQLLITHKSGEVALVAARRELPRSYSQCSRIPMHNWLRIAQDYGCLNVIDWYDGIQWCGSSMGQSRGSLEERAQNWRTTVTENYQPIFAPNVSCAFILSSTKSSRSPAAISGLTSIVIECLSTDTELRGLITNGIPAYRESGQYRR